MGEKTTSKRGLTRVAVAFALAAVVTSGVGLTPTGGPVAAAAGSALAMRTGPVGGPCGYSNTFGAPRPGGRKHLGVDIIAAQGVPLIAVDDGIISKLVPDAPGNTGGNYLRLKIADGSYYSYLHLEAFADGIIAGARVQAGDVIGYVGMTGSAPVPHLHFEVHPFGGDAVDPTPFVIAAGTCGPPYDYGTPKPKPSPRVTDVQGIPLSPATREGTLITVPPIADASAQSIPADLSAVVDSPTIQAGTIETTPTDAPPPSPSVGPAGLVVFAPANEIPANHTTGVTVVGFPGLPATARSVTLAITLIGATDGRAAIWSCGTRAGLDGGIPLQSPIAGVEVTSTVTLSPGDGGRVCLVASTAYQLRVAVVGIG